MRSVVFNYTYCRTHLVKPTIACPLDFVRRTYLYCPPRRWWFQRLPLALWHLWPSIRSRKLLLPRLEAPFLPLFLQFKGAPPRHYLPPSLALLLASLHLAPPDRLLFLVMFTSRLRLLATFSPVSAITDSSSARFVAPITSPFASPSLSSSLPSFGNSGSVPKSVKAFIVGRGHAPIPAKLAKKIIEGQFVDLTNLLTVNLRAVEQEPQTFLEGKLLVSNAKCRKVEIKDILTWTEAFTIFQLVLCASNPLHWLDLTRYKLLIIQTAHQYRRPSLAWLEYDLAFRRDGAASGLNDWSKMNLNLYSFHLRSPTSSSLQPRPSSLSGFLQSSSDSSDSHRHTPFCHSWNEGQCRWLFGRCRFRHNCSNCEGEHTKANCPFPLSAGFRSRSPSPGGIREQY